MPKEYPIHPISPQSIDPSFGQAPGSDIGGRFTPVQVDSVAGLSLLLATGDNASTDVLLLAARLRQGVRAAHQPLSGMGVAPADADVLAGIYRSDPIVRRTYHQVDMILSSLPMVGAGVLQEFAAWAVAAATAEQRLRGEIATREQAIASIRRVLEIYTAARATTAPAMSARR